jgi:hypothetical protein
LTTGFIGLQLQLLLITVYTLYNSQFTITLAESSHCIFTGCLYSNIAGSVHLQNSLAALHLFSEDCCYTVDSRLGNLTPNSQLTATASLTELNRTDLCSVTHLYSKGTLLGPLLRHVVTRHVVFTVMLPCARPPCCFRHSLLFWGCIATVVSKRHIAYSMHVTLLPP